MRFSLVIPCFNEAATIPQLLKGLENIAADPRAEVILVDNGSTDESPRILREKLEAYPGYRLVRVEENQGYGNGILQGLREAAGDILGWTHADLQTDPDDALKGLQIFESQGSEIFVKGRRFGRPASDVFFTAGMSVFETVLMGKGMWDINAQPTMFSRKFFQSWQNPPSDFSLDLYAYWMAKQKNLPVYRFPVEFRSRQHGVSHWNTSWREKRKFIKRTVSFSLELKKRQPQ